MKLNTGLFIVVGFLVFSQFKVVKKVERDMLAITFITKISDILVYGLLQEDFGKITSILFYLFSGNFNCY